jgi:radical SAM superfamily enzyme with C-terminal helix-hairpin-helix motif
MNDNKVIILDCYTDEPSGYGVRPYLGTHQTHLSQALSYKNIPHKYLTIDDLRYASGERDSGIRILNKTTNTDSALDIINNAEQIYLIMGCFVDYKYFSAQPPKSYEVYNFLKNSKAKKVLFYVLGSESGLPEMYKTSKLATIMNDVCIGNTYRYIIEPGFDKTYLKPNYDLLNKISGCKNQIIDQLIQPVIAEVETGTGCDRPTCRYCIEAERHIKPEYISPESVVSQVISLYNSGVRHFRLGRQPNLFHYQYNNVEKFNQLLSEIREKCPNLETLHIDNVNMKSVVMPHGEEFVKTVVKYCTDGNVAPFGIESFDDSVRRETRISGQADEVFKAIEIMNKHGAVRGENGFPKFLPGVNLMHNLWGQSEKTHDINMQYLEKILEQGLMTQRLFYRIMTPNSGVSFSEQSKIMNYYQKCYTDIVDKFVLPMQSRVYEPGIILKGFREVVGNELRTLGTCSIKARVSDNNLMPYKNYDIQVIGNVSEKIISGKIIKER